MSKFEWHPVDEPDDPHSKWELITRPKGSTVRPFHWRLTSPPDAKGKWVLIVACYVKAGAEFRKFWLATSVFQSLTGAKARTERACGMLFHESVPKGLANMLAQYEERVH